jgi:hypothetical protein
VSKIDGTSIKTTSIILGWPLKTIQKQGNDYSLL